MTDWMVWWLLAGLAIVLELLTGTFFLLMLAVGLVAGALAAHAGLGLTGQLLTAAIVGGGAVALWQRWRARHPIQAPPERNPDINLDIGQTLVVERWPADGWAQVRYRGANWSVQLQPGTSPSVHSRYRIVQVHGNTLIVQALDPEPPSAAADPGAPSH